MRFGGNIIKILLLLCCGQFTNILNKQLFFVVTAEPADKGGRSMLITGLFKEALHRYLRPITAYLRICDVHGVLS